MARIKAQAVVLRETNWSETSQLVTLLTDTHGLIRGLAKGSKRQSPSSIGRFSGGLEMLSLGQVVAVVKPTVGLATITEWDLIDPHIHLRRNWQAQQLAFYAADLLCALLAEHDVHSGVFTAAADYLKSLSLPGPCWSCVLEFQWRLLVDIGLQPRLDDDVQTGDILKPADTYLFDASAGGLVVDARPQSPWPNHETGNGPWRVRSQTVELLREIAGTWEKEQSMPTMQPIPAMRACRLLNAYIRHVLGRELPTMPILWQENESVEEAEK